MTARGFVHGLWLFVVRRAVQSEIRIHEKYCGWRRGLRCVDASVGSVLRIEVERYRGERVTLQRLAKALGVPVTALLE